MKRAHEGHRGTVELPIGISNKLPPQAWLDPSLQCMQRVDRCYMTACRNDYTVNCCCGPCSACQEAREVKFW